LEPIEGIDATVIAEKLGLNPKDFASKAKISKADTGGDHMIKTNEKKYRMCEKFFFPCAGCKSINFVAAPFKRDTSSKVISIFEKCVNAECKVKPLEYLPAIKNHLRVATTKAINRFYENWHVCDNPMCCSNTQNYAWPCDGTSNLRCLECLEGNLQRVFTSEELNTQLDYYNFMFDIHSFESIEALHLGPEVVAAYDMMLNNDLRNLSNYFTIELKTKFNAYDVQSKVAEKNSAQTCWQQFFTETYADA